MPEPRVRLEYSSGGLVHDGERLLMVKVENLEGQLAWTFPKGHIEKGEKAPEAALREVEEETGYRCEIIPPPGSGSSASQPGGGIIKPFEKVHYWFKREGHLVKKSVTWYLMRPLDKIGVHDADEILETRWVSFDEAEKLSKYKSDKQLLKKLKTR